MSAICCAPRRPAAEKILTPPHHLRPAPVHRHGIEQVVVSATVLQMGDHHGDGLPGDGETPVHAVSLRTFDIDATCVTNDDFAAFVDATAYRTDAEQYGFSAVFHLALHAPQEDILGQPDQTPWWLGVRGADWAHPQGRRSNLDGIGDHPVVHVSWNDAIAYCQWAGRRLPTEAQWETSARGGRSGNRYPWGDTLDETDGWRCNIWRGDFPTTNTLADGFLTTAPVRSFRPNDLGIWQSVGNVWEWCADWFDPTYYRWSPPIDPTGPDTGTTRALRGGSFLCHDSYCNRYRVAARSSNTPDSSAANIGFRTAADPERGENPR